MYEMKSIDFKGKPYIEVKERVKFLRLEHEEYKIETDIIKIETDIIIIMKAILKNEKNEIVATGHAYEVPNSSFINKTSYIENCETSAIGRCLAIFGIGIDTSLASYSEVKQAVEQQSNYNPNDERTEVKITWLSSSNYQKILDNNNANEVKQALEMYQTSTHKMKKDYKAELTIHYDQLIAKEMNNGQELL